jgi:glutaminyl-peptide cyclotransferase
LRRFHPRASILISSIALAAALGCACANKTTPSATATGGSTPPPAVRPATSPAQEMTVQVINSFPHDHAAFTQGLLFADGKLYESTGLVGQSSLRRVDLTSGHVETQIAIDAPIFAEGLALAGDNLFQISWQNGRAFVYRKADFSRVREHSYSGEGWGLAFDPQGQRLVMSDGTAHITFRDPASFAITGGIDVARAGTPVRNLNELEWVDGQIYANVWQTNVIVRIDPASGAVTGWIDAAGLLSSEERVGTDVLNGIAYAPARGTFFITGKLWPRLFEVKFVAH